MRYRRIERISLEGEVDKDTRRCGGSGRVGSRQLCFMFDVVEILAVAESEGLEIALTVCSQRQTRSIGMDELMSRGSKRRVEG